MTCLMNSITSSVKRIASSVKTAAQVGVLGSVLMAGSVMSLNVNAEDILTSTPVTYALATELTKGTDITTEYLPPKRYGIDRLPNWFGTKGASKVFQSGEKATVAVTLSSIWQADPTFVYDPFETTKNTKLRGLLSLLTRLRCVLAHQYCVPKR